ncbi:MAG TPA: histidine kinase dimerization/phospho-acceptor domain-containing protein, partial [Ktedonobacteraceae bacterium]|nr:histidine kinase dimerization/phospho-acceptor domain-containing protein [Ktedonobacteraceae bacterium]
MKLMKRLFTRTHPRSLIKQLKNSLLTAVSMLVFVLFLFSITSTVIVANQYSFNQKKADINAIEGYILNSVLDQSTAIRTYIITDAPTSLGLFTSGRLSYLMYMQRLKHMIIGNGLVEASATLTQLDQQYNEWYRSYALVEINNMQLGHFTAARSDQATILGKNLFLNFRAAQIRLVQTASQNLSEIQQKITTADIAAFALAIGLSIMVIILLQRTFQRFAMPFYTQLETFKEATHQLTAGERAARVPPLDYEELNDVAQSFNLMAHALQQQQEELQLQYTLAREANVSKSRFLAGMSHELRTPLNAIIGFSELLYDEVVGTVSEEQKDYLGDVLASGRHLLDLINEVLDLSKVEAGKIVFHPEVVHVEEVLDLVLHTVHQMAADKEVLLLSELDPTLVDVRIDPVRFRQVL